MEHNSSSEANCLLDGKEMFPNVWNPKNFCSGHLHTVRHWFYPEPDEPNFTLLGSLQI